MMKPKRRFPSWKKIEKALRIATERLEKDTTAFAMQEKQGFIQRIKDQKFPSFKKYPLSPKYLAKKKKAGADLRTMIASKHYVQSIKLFRSRKDGDLKLRIGFAPYAKAWTMTGEKTKIPLSVVIRANELGSAASNLPPRAHWGPYRREIKKRAVKMRKKFAKQFASRVRDQLNGKSVR